MAEASSAGLIPSSSIGSNDVAKQVCQVEYCAPWRRPLGVAIVLWLATWGRVWG